MAFGFGEVSMRRITIRDIPWMRDAEDDHKSNWHANSKGGEPNHYTEPKRETKYIYYFFKTKSVNDPRPLKVLKPLGVPYWISSYEYDTNLEPVAAIIVCYLPTGINLSEYWDDAYDIETTPCNEIKYTSRFPKPDWLE